MESKVLKKSNVLMNSLHIIINEWHILHEKNYNKNFIAAELMRNTHSIEKGLSIEKPRLGFGHQKQKEMMEQIELLYNDNSSVHKEICIMALCALRDYVTFHKDNHYCDNFCIDLEDFLSNYPVEKTNYGGTLQISKSSLQFNENIIELFFKTRHSIRDYDKKPVDDKKLKKALSLAQTAPSACNRQGVRVYVLSNARSKILSAKMANIGGFADDVDRFIIITGKTSAYRSDEIDQYIVSASIYTAYLSLTLHLYGLGACIVQRPVIWTKYWDSLRKELNIPADEQMVCLLAIGNLKETFKVPVSHRLSTEEIVRFIE